MKMPVHNAPAPMATAHAGGSIKLMFGGNGHSRGNFGGVNTGDPGKVSVYWAGQKEREIVDVKEVRLSFPFFSSNTALSLWEGS
jgi:hypothetical protein